MSIDESADKAEKRERWFIERADSDGYDHLLDPDKSWGKEYRDRGLLILEYGWLTKPPPPGTIRVLALLQNAWIQRDDHPYYRRLGCWPRQDWLWATALSSTGKKIKFLMERDDVWLDDATPVVGVGSSSVKHPYDPEYIRRMIAALGPETIVTFGVSAREGVNAAGWTGNLIATCHPAYRFMSRAILEQVDFLSSTKFISDEPIRIEIKPARPSGPSDTPPFLVSRI